GGMAWGRGGACEGGAPRRASAEAFSGPPPTPGGWAGNSPPCTGISSHRRADDGKPPGCDSAERGDGAPGLPSSARARYVERPGHRAAPARRAPVAFGTTAASSCGRSVRARVLLSPGLRVLGTSGLLPLAGGADLPWARVSGPIPSALARRADR